MGSFAETRIMEPRDPGTTDRTLFLALGLLLIYGTFVIIWGFIRVERRAEHLATVELERALEVATARIERTLSPVLADLDRFALKVAKDDTIRPAELLEFGTPLLQGQQAYLAVKLADDDGNELTLCRQDTSWLLFQAEKGSVAGPPLVWSARDPRTPLAEWRLTLADSLIDPRTAAWFARSVGNTRMGPVWTTDRSNCGPSGGRTHVVSKLVRSERTEGRYQVIALELILERLPDMLGGTRSGSAVVTLLDEQGAPVQPRPDLSDPDQRLIDEVVDGLGTGKSDRIQVGAGDERSWAGIRGWRGTGPAWNLVAVVRDKDVAGRFASDVRVILAGVVLLVLLAISGIWAFLRKRRDARVRRFQQLRSQNQERKLAKALGEREVLDREVHHRVKNNLQVVSSLLNLQAMRLAEGKVKEEFMRGKRRIDSMALVHHKLYALQDLRGIDLDLFFRELMDALLKDLDPTNGSVSHEVRTGGVQADADTAIQLGIILSELFINCHQHAFPHGSGGHVEVQLDLVEDRLYRLVVRDNGVGMGERRSDGDTRLGLEIVEALAEQLDGSLHVTSGSTGTAVEVLFRMNANEASGG